MQQISHYIFKSIILAITLIIPMYPAAHEPKELFSAVASGDFYQTYKLLNTHPDWLNSKNEFGQTPLCIAIIKKRAPIMGYLIRCGADIHALDNKKCSLLHYALKAVPRHTEYCAALLNNGHSPFICCPETPPIVLSAQCGFTSITKMLLEKGAYVDQCNKDGISPLEAAAGNNGVFTAKLLLEYGANINVHSTDWSTPIHWGLFWQNRNQPQLLTVLIDTQPNFEKILPKNAARYLRDRELGLRCQK